MFRSPIISRVRPPASTVYAIDEPSGANAGPATLPSEAATNRSVAFDPDAIALTAYTPGLSRRSDTNAISLEPARHDGWNSLDGSDVTCLMSPVASVSTQTS